MYKSNEECNGWINKETWHINLSGFDDVFTEMARSAVQENGSVLELSEQMEERLKSLILEGESTELSGLERDLLRCALDRVDWDRFAEIYWNEAIS